MCIFLMPLFAAATNIECWFNEARTASFFLPYNACSWLNYISQWKVIFYIAFLHSTSTDFWYLPLISWFEILFTSVRKPFKAYFCNLASHRNTDCRALFAKRPQQLFPEREARTPGSERGVDVWVKQGSFILFIHSWLWVVITVTLGTIFSFLCSVSACMGTLAPLHQQPTRTSLWMGSFH